MSVLPDRSALDDPLHDWRVRGRPGSIVADTVLAAEPPMVGREDLLVQFERLVARARRCDQVVLALSGEAGCGKTRLLREFARRAGEQDLEVRWAGDDGSAPRLALGPRPLIMLCDRVASSSAVLSRVELATLHDHVGLLVVVALPSTEPEDGDGRRLYRLLAGAARQGSVVELGIPPLSEPELVELTRILVSGQPGPLLQATVSRLSEGNPYLAIQVILELVHADLLAEVAGNRELRRKPGSDFLPAPVASVTRHSILGLDQAAATTLATAAAIGPGFQFDLLTTICQQPAEQVLAHVEIGLRQGIIDEAAEPPDDFQFVHELVRRTLYTTLNSIRRRHVHQAIATALEADASDADRADTVALLAYHFGRGVDRRRALAYTLRALARSERLCAWDDAIGECRQALNLAREVDAGETTEVKLLEHLAGLYFGRGRTFAAGTCWRDALHLYEGRGDLGRQAVVMARLAALGPVWKSIEEAERACAAAEATCPTSATTWQFDVCIELGMANERHGRIDAALAYSRRAADLVRADDRAAYGLALTNMANPLTSSGRPHEAVDVLTTALELLDAQPPEPTDREVPVLEHLRDPRRMRCLALADLARALVYVGDIDRAYATAELGCAEEDRLAMRGGRAHRALAQIELARGEPRKALDVLTRECSFEATELMGASRAADLMLLAEAHRAAGDLTASLHAATDGIHICERSGAREYLAGLYLTAGRVRLARQELDEAMEAVSAAHGVIQATGTVIFEPQALELETAVRAARGESGAEAPRQKARSTAPAPSVGRPAPLPRMLSQRELEVLSLVAEGRTNRDIAEALVVSDKTVKRHLSNILDKLGVSTRAAAVNQGLRLGLL